MLNKSASRAKNSGEGSRATFDGPLVITLTQEMIDSDQHTRYSQCQDSNTGSSNLLVSYLLSIRYLMD